MVVLLLSNNNNAKKKKKFYSIINVNKIQIAIIWYFNTLNQ
jgi:hypothetical protein